MTGGFTANMLIRDFIQIDSIFGYAAGIGEMLLQCHNGYIELLPTPAFGWTNGAFRGMRTRGGFECDLVWKDERPRAGRIVARLGGPCAVKALGLAGILCPDGTTVAPDADGIVRFGAEKGARYELVF